MAEVRIEIGATDGFRYIGVQPPLTDEQAERLQQYSNSNPLVALPFGLREPYNGEPYSETGIYSDVLLTPRTADRRILEAASSIADALRAGGDTVVVDERIRQIGFGVHLFGGQDEIRLI